MTFQSSISHPAQLASSRKPSLRMGAALSPATAPNVAAPRALTLSSDKFQRSGDLGGGGDMLASTTTAIDPTRPNTPPSPVIPANKPPAVTVPNLVVGQITVVSPSTGMKLFSIGENPETNAAQMVMYGSDGAPVAFLNSNVAGKTGASFVLSSKKLVTMITASEGSASSSRAEMNAGMRTYWQPTPDAWQLITYQGPTLSNKHNVIGVNGVFSVPHQPDKPGEPVRATGVLNTPEGSLKNVRAIVVN